MHALLDPSEEPDHGTQIPGVIGVAVFEIGLPPVFNDLSSLLALFQMQLDIIAPFTCWGPFKARLLFQTALPMILVLSVLLGCVLRAVFVETCREGRSIWPARPSWHQAAIREVVGRCSRPD